jgi:hypothetical protein
VNRLSRLRSTAAIAALLGGALWLIDVAVIIAIDDSFDPLDTLLFVGGLLAIGVAAGLVAALAGARYDGARRVLAAVATFVGLVVVLTLVSAAGDALSHAVYSGGNRGLHGEIGILAIALAALAGGAWLAPRRARGAARPATIGA